MRVIAVLLLASAAAPAVAAEPRASASTVAVPPALTDPAMADRLGRMMGALTHAVMNLPVGEVEAAIENRPATPADRAKTVRDVAADGDPRVEQRIADQAAASGKTMQAAGKALVSSLPAIMGAMETARGELEKAVANLPDPTYPKR